MTKSSPARDSTIKAESAMMSSQTSTDGSSVTKSKDGSAHPHPGSEARVSICIYTSVDVQSILDLCKKAMMADK